MILRRAHLSSLITTMLLIFSLIYYLLLNQANAKMNINESESISLSTLIDSIGTKQFYNCDLGDGIRIEILTMLRSLNQNVLVAGSKGNRSPYKQYFDDSNNGIQFYTGKKGKVLYPTNYNHIIHMHHSPNKNLYEDDIKKMFEFYQTDDSLSSSDAIVCSNPLSMCEAFLPYNKTIIWIASHRYSLGRCSKDSWNRLNEHITESIKDNKNRAKSFLAAMSMYDVEYINYFTGLHAILIEPTALLYGALELRNKEVQAMKTEILLGSTTHVSKEELNHLMNSAKKNNFTMIHPQKLYGNYKLEQVVSHPAVIIIPHSVHTQTFVEFYALGIPIFIPSIDFLITLSTLHERTTSGRENCLSAQDYDKDGDHIHIKTVDHIHHHAVHNKAHNISHITSTIHPAKSINSRHTANPESEDLADIKYWLKFSNQYYWPHVTYFNSWDELFLKLKSADLVSIRARMIEENDKRLIASAKSWINLISAIERGRQVPKDYEHSLSTLWNVKKLQIE